MSEDLSDPVGRLTAIRVFSRRLLHLLRLNLHLRILNQLFRPRLLFLLLQDGAAINVWRRYGLTRGRRVHRRHRHVSKKKNGGLNIDQPVEEEKAFLITYGAKIGADCRCWVSAGANSGFDNSEKSTRRRCRFDGRGHSGVSATACSGAAWRPRPRGPLGWWPPRWRASWPRSASSTFSYAKSEIKEFDVVSRMTIWSELPLSMEEIPFRWLSKATASWWIDSYI